MTPIRRAISSIVVCLATALAGCATVVHGTNQAIPVTSSPTGARVAIDGNPIGVTPVLATVSRGRSHLVSIAYDTFPSVDVALNRHVSAWAMGDLVLYIVPAIVDFSNGAAYGFSTDTVRAQFGASARDDIGRRTARPDTSGAARLPTESRVTATVFSATLGFGAGHWMIGDAATGRKFMLTECVSGAVAMAGLFMGFAGQDAGAVPFFGGSAVLIGARVWEVLDVVSRSSAPSGSTPAKIGDAGARDLRIGVAPFVDRRGPGLAVRASF